MKNIFAQFLISTCILGSVLAQYQHTIVLQPGPQEARDADLFSAPEWMNQNFGDTP